MSENWKKILALLVGGLLGWASAVISNRLGMSVGRGQTISYVLYGVGAAMIVVALVRRRKEKNQRVQR